MEDINKVIGKNLMQLRKNAKLTQLELAEQFNYTDKSISKWEKGESLPSIDVLYSLAEFYGVTLDSLTSQDDILLKPKAEKQIRDKMFPLHLVISLIVICSLWAAVTALQVSLYIGLHKNFYTLYIWTIPLSCILSIIFNSVWGKPRYLFAILSVLIWSVIVAFYVQFLPINMWPLFILGAPLQIVVIVCGALITPKRKKKNPNSSTGKIETLQEIAKPRNKKAKVVKPKQEKEVSKTVDLPQIRSINEDKKD